MHGCPVWPPSTLVAAALPGMPRSSRGSASSRSDMKLPSLVLPRLVLPRLVLFCAPHLNTFGCLNKAAALSTVGACPAAGEEPESLLARTEALIESRMEAIAAEMPTVELTQADKIEVEVISNFYDTLCRLVMSMKAVDTLSLVLVEEVSLGGRAARGCPACSWHEPACMLHPEQRGCRCPGQTQPRWQPLRCQ